MFFRVADVPAFKAALKTYRPTTSADVLEFLHEIGRRKRARRGGRIEHISKALSQIAFSRMGLNYIGETEAMGDVRFDTHAMRDDRERLGDQAKWDDMFDKPYPDPINGSANDDRGALHGVFSVAGSGKSTRLSLRLISHDRLHLERPHL